MDQVLVKSGSDEEDDPFLASLRVELASRLIKSRRALGERETLSDAYASLMAAWRARNVSARSMGLNPAAFALRRIDDTMWAARQRALGDDVDGAESWAREALNLINKSFPDPAFVTGNYRRDLASLRCETLHFLAFRIAYERREWTQAALLTEDALQTLGISPEWQRRLQSQAVLYDFAGGQMALARKRLNDMLADAQEDSTRAFSLFWLARVYEQMGQKTESDFYLRALIQEQPLSYYSVVAAPSVGLLASDAWLQNFGDLEKLRGRLRSISLPASADIGSTRSNWQTSRQLAEILIAARVAGPWARAAVADAAEAAFKDSRPDRNPQVFLYLSRLAYSAGDFGRAIELTTQLSSSVEGFWNRYPEQIFIIYPFPRLKTFSGVAGTSGRVTLMLGLARQESSFRPDARSAARAYGYMQLTAATARRIMGEQAPASDDLIETMLLDPQTSIRLSARYMDLLDQRFSGSEMLMAAAYNAGEFAVSSWRKRRDSQDQPLFIETIPYGETKGYVKAVLRNTAVYRRLLPLTRESLAGNKKDS
jgi:soluble lytic murein transglycosylase-like protein